MSRCDIGRNPRGDKGRDPWNESVGLAKCNAGRLPGVAVPTTQRFWTNRRLMGTKLRGQSTVVVFLDDAASDQERHDGAIHRTPMVPLAGHCARAAVFTG